MCHNSAQDASKLEHRATLPSRFAGAFLCVFRSILVQLRFDDISELRNLVAELCRSTAG